MLLQKGAGPELFKQESGFTGNQLPFVGFTFSRDKLFHLEHDPGHDTSIKFARNSPSATTLSPRRNAALTRTKTVARPVNDDEIKTLRRNVADLQEQIKLLSEENVTLEFSLADVQKANVAKDERIQVAESQRQTAERALHTAEDAADSLRKKLEASAEKDQALLQLEIGKLKTQLDKAAKDRADSEKALKTEIADLKEKLEAANRATAKAERSAQVSEEQRNQLKLSADEADARLNDERSKSAKLKQAKAAVETELSQLQFSVNEIKRSLESSQRAFAQSEAVADDLRAKAAQLQKDGADNAERVDDLEEVNKDLTQKVADLKAQLSKRSSEVVALEDEVADLETAKTKAADEVRTLKAKCSKLQAELEESQFDSPKKAHKGNAGAALEEKLSEAAEQLVQAQAKLRDEARKRADIEAELEKAEDELSASRLEVKKL